MDTGSPARVSILAAINTVGRSIMLPSRVKAPLPAPDRGVSQTPHTLLLNHEQHPYTFTCKEKKTRKVTTHHAMKNACTRSFTLVGNVRIDDPLGFRNHLGRWRKASLGDLDLCRVDDLLARVAWWGVRSRACEV